MISLRKLSGGVLVGWISTLVSVGVGLFMAPFLIHHLGEAGYGAWVIVQSAVSYMYFLEFGLRTSVIRFSAAAHTRDDHEEVSNLVSAALWLRIWTAGILLAVAGALSLLLPHLFRIPQQYQLEARLALLVSAITLACTLVFSVFGAVLSSLGWFDLLGTLDIIRTGLASIGLIPIILAGHGLVAMALWQLIVVLGVNLAIMFSCFRVYPKLKCRFARPDRAILISLFSLSLYVLIYNCGGQLILYTDNIVAGAIVAASAVSYYAVAGKMMEYVRQIAISILQFIMPLASSYGVRKDYGRLQQLHLRGSQAVLLVTYPLVITIFVRGSTLLRLWIGTAFSAEATGILRTLTIALALMLANSSVNGVTLALDRQRTLAFVAVGEGAANLILSIFLAHQIGLIGIAVGTLIPTVITSLFFWPRYLCRLIRMSTIDYIVKAWLCPIAAMVPFIIATYWVQGHRTPYTLFGLAMQTIMLVPVVGVGAALVFRRQVPTVWRLLIQRNLRPLTSDV